MEKEEIIIRISELETELLQHECIYDFHNYTKNVECSVCDNFERSCDKLLDMWKDDEECQHLDYTDTLDGSVCNDCQKEAVE